MLADIVTIGDELLIGQVVNTNSSWIAKQLNLIGITVNRITSVSDKKEEILAILKEASGRSQLVLITGGLGPTSDDITKPTLCEYFNTHLVLNKDALSHVEKLLASRNVKMNTLNHKQAEVLAGCDVIFNANGTAPGMWIEKDKVVYVAMPGVPFEMEGMMESEILPRLKKQFNTPFIHHFTILTQGIAESKMAQLIAPWEKQLPNSIKLAYLPSPGMLKLRLSAVGNNEEEIKNIVVREYEQLKPLIEDSIYGFNDDKLEAIIGNILETNGLTMATAESCTGGKIAHMITSIPGSSAYFKGSVVAYSNEIKIKVLNVDPALIAQYGAVSKQVVESMAQNIINLFDVDFAVATSGVAGPSGGSVNKPVGTTWIAVASKTNLYSEKFNFADNRERNITKACAYALNMLRKFILTIK